MHAPHIIIVRLHTADPARAAHVALDVDRRPVGVRGERGRGVVRDAEGHGDDDPGFVQVFVVESAVQLAVGGNRREQEGA